MKNYCFITSMFRSGSTMISRMLGTHDSVSSASDPMRPLFNSFRYDIATNNYQKKHNRYDPLDDYFLTNCNFLKKIINSNFDVELSENFDVFNNKIKRSAKPYSAIWAEAIEPLFFSTYSQYINYFFEKIDEIYGKFKVTTCIAFKEVWATEFYPALKRSFPAMKCIAIVRDPRAVVASNNATGEPYPYIFMGRQWRKLACLAAYLDYEYEDVFLLRYEDIVQEPEKYVTKICDFLDIEYNDSLLDLSLYKDGWGKPWKQNSNYKDIEYRRINANSMDKWKTVLDDQDVLSVEFFTHDWMKHFGYEPQYSKDEISALTINDYKQLDYDKLANWIKPFAFDSNKEKLANELLLEKLRMSKNRGLSADEKIQLHLKWW